MEIAICIWNDFKTKAYKGIENQLLTENKANL